MPSLDDEEREFPIFKDSDVRAWRDGNWYFVTLAGELVFKRYTRDEAFTHAWVVFNGSRSPDYPRQRRYFESVVLRGPWPVERSQAFWLRNHIEVKIERVGGDA